VPDKTHNVEAGPFSTPEEYWAWRRRADSQAHSDGGAPGRGTIPAASLSRNDAAYLRYRAHDYVMARRNGDLTREVLSGSHDDIARVIQLGDIANPGMAPWIPDSLQLVEEVGRAFDSIPEGDRNP
jgi:hypothetical protein